MRQTSATSGKPDLVPQLSLALSSASTERTIQPENSSFNDQRRPDSKDNSSLVSFEDNHSGISSSFSLSDAILRGNQTVARLRRRHAKVDTIDNDLRTNRICLHSAPNSASSRTSSSWWDDTYTTFKSRNNLSNASQESNCISASLKDTYTVVNSRNSPRDSLSQLNSRDNTIVASSRNSHFETGMSSMMDQSEHLGLMTSPLSISKDDCKSIWDFPVKSDHGTQVSRLADTYSVVSSKNSQADVMTTNFSIASLNDTSIITNSNENSFVVNPNKSQHSESNSRSTRSMPDKKSMSSSKISSITNLNNVKSVDGLKEYHSVPNCKDTYSIASSKNTDNIVCLKYTYSMSDSGVQAPVASSENVHCIDNFKNNCYLPVLNDTYSMASSLVSDILASSKDVHSVKENSLGVLANDLESPREIFCISDNSSRIGSVGCSSERNAKNNHQSYCRPKGSQSKNNSTKNYNEEDIYFINSSDLQHCEKNSTGSISTDSSTVSYSINSSSDSHSENMTKDSRFMNSKRDNHYQKSSTDSLSATCVRDSHPENSRFMNNVKFNHSMKSSTRSLSTDNPKGSHSQNIPKDSRFKKKAKHNHYQKNWTSGLSTNSPRDSHSENIAKVRHSMKNSTVSLSRNSARDSPLLSTSMSRNQFESTSTNLYPSSVSDNQSENSVLSSPSASSSNKYFSVVGFSSTANSLTSNVTVSVSVASMTDKSDSTTTCVDDSCVVYLSDSS